VAENKKRARDGAALIFLDETGFSEAPEIRRTWAPRGKTPVLRAAFRWHRCSATGILVYRMQRRRARLLLKMHERPVKGPDVAAVLRHLATHVQGRVILLWDGLPAHRAKPVRDWLRKHKRIRIERLPAYSPELNPVEGLWSWMKGGRLANLCRELEEVREEARKAGRAARRRNSLLWGFLKKTELPL